MPLTRTQAPSFSARDAAVLSRARTSRRPEALEARSTENPELMARVRRARAATRSPRAASGSARKRARAAQDAPRAKAASDSKRASREALTLVETRDGRDARPADKPEGARAARDGQRTPRRGAQKDARKHPLSALAQWLFDLNRPGKVALAMAAAVAVLFAFFYQPSASLWAAYRDHDQLLAQMAELEAVSGELESDIAKLRTEEGIADEARIRGYAPAGEEAADARALVGEDDDELVPVLSEVAPEDESQEPPYVQLLDTFFGYQPRTS